MDSQFLHSILLFKTFVKAKMTSTALMSLQANPHYHEVHEV